MKFALYTTILTLCSGLAAAQGVGIVFPPDGSTVTAGSNITVEVDRPVRWSWYLAHIHINTHGNTQGIAIPVYRGGGRNSDQLLQ